MMITSNNSAGSVPPASAERDEQLRNLEEAIQQLDERERLAIHLYYLEADPVRAAGEALGLSRSGYYKLLTRARRRLAVHLGVMRVA